MKTVDSWLQWAKTQIDALDAELIALYVFAPHEHEDRSWLAAHGDITPEQRHVLYANSLVRRRLRGVPLAYVLEEKEFYGRNFMVRPGVLIPRPETEAIIDTVKSLDLPERPHFLEIGTGSGCIAVTLALEYPQSYVLATDISRKALEIAGQNDIYHEGRIDLTQANLFQELIIAPHEHFDVVVANLPYVNKDWDWVDPENLAYEPANAIYARGSNGLSVYRRFFKELFHQRNEDNIWIDYVVVEADPCQQRELIEIAKKAGFFHLQTNGYALAFEDKWRYWWDSEKDDFVHKPKNVLEVERKTGLISYIPDEVDLETGKHKDWAAI